MRYDIAIIGTGPAGVSAAITSKVRGKNILLIGSSPVSSKVEKAHAIDNYPGLPHIGGAELAQRFQDHLRSMDIEITTRHVASVYAMGGYFTLQVDGQFLEATCVILATGVNFGKPLPGEDENLGRGVSYCATCDAALYHGKSASVAGYSPEAEADVRFLAEVADRVYYIPVYSAKAKADLDNGRVMDLPANVEVVRGKPASIAREGGKMALSLSGADEGKDVLTADGIFLLRESVAPDKLVPGLKMDGNHVGVNRKMETNLPGFYAAGDITGTPYQYIKSAGEGNVAALSAVSYLDSLRK